MKKVIFGGLCMITAVLLLWFSFSVDLYFNGDYSILVTIISIALFIYGFILGIIGLKKDKQ